MKCTRIISLGGTDCIQSTVRSIFYNNRILNIIAAEFWTSVYLMLAFINKYCTCYIDNQNNWYNSAEFQISSQFDIQTWSGNELIWLHYRTPQKP